MILAFGLNGQVGQALSQLPGLQCLSRADADLENPEACAEAIRTAAPEAVINAAAFTAVDEAEKHEARATAINAHAPAAMARACAALGIPLVQISTDYVFPGTGGHLWQPQDQPDPINAYGRSKLKGEQAVQRSGAVFAVLRTSWVFSAHGNNFVKTMLRLGRERSELNIVADQIGGPTGAQEIALACRDIAQHLIADPNKSGLYHFAGDPQVSWADFARTIFDRAGLDCRVKDIPTADYPTPARRPLNSRLDCHATHATFGLDRPDWRRSLDDVLSTLGASR